MKPSSVYYLPAYSNSSRGLVKTLKLLLEQAGLDRVIAPHDLVAVKTHFGEPGNTTFIRPLFLRRIVDFISSRGGQPFLTDTNTLYVGGRTNSVRHLHTAVRHGFDFAAIGAPVIIADGLRGNAGTSLSASTPSPAETAVASEISSSDALVLATHFKGHELFAFGGSIKNLGMGCTNRAGKLYIHATIAPSVEKSSCTGCATCMKWCGYQAITIEKGTAQINPERCVGCAECISVCPEHAVRINWEPESQEAAQKRLAEAALGAIRGKEKKSFFINFLLYITPNCDCLPWSEPPIVPDLGVLASLDPVAIDRASIDLVNRTAAFPSAGLKSGPEPGGDKFRGLYPQVPYEIQLEWGEKIGLGQQHYRLIEINP